MLDSRSRTQLDFLEAAAVVADQSMSMVVRMLMKAIEPWLTDIESGEIF
jgi:hypothetical protein